MAQPADPPAPIGGATLTAVETTGDCGCCGDGQSGSGVGTVIVACCPDISISRRWLVEAVGCNNLTWYFEYQGMFIPPNTEVFAVPPGYTGTIAHIWSWADGNCLVTNESFCPDETPIANHVPQNISCNIDYDGGVPTGIFSWGNSFGPETIQSCDSALTGSITFEQCEPFLQTWSYGEAFLQCTCLAFPGITLVITEA